jgi:CO dehydrogenase/acetyl-CoA synthase delta subunit
LAFKGNILKKERIILGMDPGTSIMGYGIIRVEGKQISRPCGTDEKDF